MTLRSVVFWAKDSLTGRRIKKHLSDIEFLNQCSPAAIERKQALISNQIAFVTQSVPQYRGLRGATTLADFPVLTKESFREREEYTYAAGINKERQFIASTSGSTGTPFRVLHDSNKRQRIDAESIYFGRLAGFQIGIALYHLKIWTDRNTINKLGYYMRNIKPIDVTQFGKAEVQGLLTTLESRMGRASLIAYSSSLETIARTLSSLETTSTKCRVVSIIGQSEPLSSQARKTLSEHLGIVPVARYGMEEVGIIAQQAPELNDDYLLNQGSHVVEILKIGEDQPAGPGELGRIVITDVVNRAQPLIRYDTGDLGAFALHQDGVVDTSRLARLEGRTYDQIYDVDDRPLAPMVAYRFWWKFPEILEYQIQQTSKGTYILRIKSPELFSREHELTEEFRKVVGAQANISIDYSPGGYTYQSGKKRPVVTDYIPRSSN